MMERVCGWMIAAFVASLPQSGFAAVTGLVTLPSNYSVEETIRRFEAAIVAKSDQGWMVFTEVDHAAAAQKNGLMLRPRTVIVFGNPRGGTANMQKAATLAIDLPPKALVWQDDEGKVWLSYNTGEYLVNDVYARHGVPPNSAAAKGFDEFLSQIAAQATQ